jgi:MoaA/NifB/PqqE/SkfB family radical SAM enzyme
VNPTDKFSTIYYEISGVCNAKCPYCLNGRHKTSTGSFVAPSQFDKTLDTICKKAILAEGGIIGLYNWGEPFLHPQLSELMHIVNSYQVPYGFSTNASRVPAIDRTFVENLRYVKFSMPGFSQKSYSRIHGFDFDVIVDNVRRIVRECREQGFRGNFSIGYHVYQFNLDEMRRADEFAAELDIVFDPYYAILNNWWQINALLDGSLDYNQLRRVSEDLFSSDIGERVAEAPAQYRCPQYDLLVINECSDVLLCCQVPPNKDFASGSLLTNGLSDILRRRGNNEICRACVGKGLAYYLNNSLNCPKFYSKPLLQKAWRRIRREIRRVI